MHCRIRRLVQRNFVAWLRRRIVALPQKIAKIRRTQSKNLCGGEINTARRGRTPCNIPHDGNECAGPRRQLLNPCRRCQICQNSVTGRRTQSCEARSTWEREALSQTPRPSLSHQARHSQQHRRQESSFARGGASPLCSSGSCRESEQMSVT